MDKEKAIIKELNSQILKNDFKKVYVFYGQEVFLIDQYTKRIAEGVVKGDIQDIIRFDGEEARFDDVINEMFSISFEQKPKVLIFKNFFKYNLSNSNLNLSAIVQRLRDLNDEKTHIIFKEYEIKENKLFNQLKAVAFCAEFSTPSMPDLIKWIQNIMAKEGKTITENMAQNIIIHYNKDMMMIYNYLQVLSSYMGKKNRVTHDDIIKTLTDNPQDHIFQMLDAFSGNDIENGFKYLKELYELKTATSRILSMILRHFKILGMIKHSSETNRKQLAKQLGIMEFFVDKYKKQAEAFTSDKIRNIIQRAIEYEYMIKKGQIDGEIALEMLLYQIVK